MKQLAQNYRSGELALVDVPAPGVGPGEVLVRSVCSLVSTGTELKKIHEAGLSLLGKARARPDQVRQVVSSVRQLGVLNTYRKVASRLDAWTPLGYSAAGVVIDVGPGVTAFATGDRVALAGAGYANHAEVNAVPVNLVAAVPEGVSFEDAAYTTVGAIAVQACRRADLRFGESALVIGLGLVGQLVARVLTAAGVRVFGVDRNDDRVRLALESGAIVDGGSPGDARLRERMLASTGGFGVDGVLLAVGSATNEPVELAIAVVRDRGAVTDVGITRIELPWKDCYAKEIDFRFSRSYGPGRYDPTYEEHGIDYPIGYVRWTEQRNMAHFLDLLATRRVSVQPLSSLVVPFAEATRAYADLRRHPECHVGVLFKFSEQPEVRFVLHRSAAKAIRNGALGVGFIGAGNYAQTMLLPLLRRRPDAHLTTVVTRRGLSAETAARRFGFQAAATDPSAVWDDPKTRLAVIATRHASHASLTAEALHRGLHVFVEKPLALTREDLRQVVAAAEGGDSQLTVGFNRRFSPLARRLKASLGRAGHGPWTLYYRVHAGVLPPGSWYADPSEGGRLRGEGCHFVDLMQYLTDALPARVFATSVSGADDVVAQITFSDHSVGVLEYVSGGEPTRPKEVLTVVGNGLTAELTNFSSLTVWFDGHRERVRSLTIDKGQRHTVDATIAAARRGGEAPISLPSLVATSACMIAMVESAISRQAVAVGDVR